MPVGVTGELYIGGSQLSRGYLNRPELTAERFLADPYGVEDARMYRTGDLAQWRADGNLWFLGRTDDQVKIRGFRIELGEIEATLAQCPELKAATVTVRQTFSGHNQMCAYFVTAPGQSLSVEDLRRFLRQRLPEYMIPSTFVALSALPLTLNGKIDRRALPDPDLCGSEKSSEYTAPRTRIETALAGIFSEILGRSRISVMDSFFDLGGDSLAAMMLLSHIEAAFGVKLRASMLFSTSSVEQLATVIERPDDFINGSLVPLQPFGSRPPLFFIHGLGGVFQCDARNYRNLALGFGPDQPVYGLQAVGIDDGAAPHIRVEDMASDYIRQIRQIQKSGPYHLGGRDIGGVIAFEMARQLVSSGERVGLLVLLDSHAPPSIEVHGLAHFLTHNIRATLKGAKRHFDQWVKQDFRQKIKYAAYVIGRRLASAVFEYRYKFGQRSGSEIPQAYRSIAEAQIIASRTYRAKAYAGSAVLFRTTETSSEFPEDPALGWAKLIKGGLETYDVPGDGSVMLIEPHVRVLAPKLSVDVPRAAQQSYRATT